MIDGTRGVAVRLAGRLGLCLIATFAAYCLAAWCFDPLAALESRQPRPPQQVIDAQTVRLGLDHPVPVRFAHWLGGVVTGDFGVTVDGRPIADELWTRAGASLRLYLVATLVAVVAGIALGVWGALARDTAVDHLLLVWSLIMLALPVFVLGTLLKILWLPINDAVGFPLLYFSGERSVDRDLTGMAAVWDRMRHLVLPTICIALPQIAFFSRYQRAAAIDVLDSPYLQAARARGLTRRAAFLRHGLRPALVPTVSLFALSFGIHLAGGVFAERVFGWHGLGDWVMAAISHHDAMVVATVTLFFALLVVCAGAVSDIVVTGLDPRLRARS